VFPEGAFVGQNKNHGMTNTLVLAKEAAAGAGSPLLGMLLAVLPVIGIVAAGALIRRINWLTAEADASMMRVTINVFMPCLMFDSILGNHALQQWDTLVKAPLVGFFTVALGIMLSLAVAACLRLGDAVTRRTFAISTGIYNYGYVPLPLALLLFNRETAGVLFVHNVGVEIAMWSVGLLVLTGHDPREGWRKIINVPLGAILTALLLNITHATSMLPDFVIQMARLLGQCAIPLGLVLVGATMADYAHEFRIGKASRTMAAACLVRLGLLPVLFLVLAKYLPAGLELRQVILLQAAMPAAVFPIIMAKHYGGDAGAALRIVIATSLAALVTLPLWLQAGMKFIGLQVVGR
jgi:predicted permease